MAAPKVVYKAVSTTPSKKKPPMTKPMKEPQGGLIMEPKRRRMPATPRPRAANKRYR